MAVLPNMASLSMCNEDSEISDHSHSPSAAAEVRQISTWLGQSKLKSLSLNNRSETKNWICLGIEEALSKEQEVIDCDLWEGASEIQQ